MSTLITVPRGTTTFKPYDKPRYSKAKEYKDIRNHYPIEFSEICCNCHQTYGRHYPMLDQACPEYQILNK